MTKKLQELFFGSDDQIDQPEDIVEQESTQPASELITQETLATIEKVENALPQVRDLETSDKEMDELAGLAKEAFNNLMDIGMQVDSRFSAEIFNSASSMLGHAITAKTAKVNKKLRMIDLQLKKAELERKLGSQSSKQTGPNGEKTDLGTGSIMNRDELIKMILSNNDANNSDNKDK